MNLTTLVKNELVKVPHSRSNEKAYLRAVFLWCGSISCAHGYHLEFKTYDEETATEVIECLKKFGIESKMLLHQNRCVVYIKGADKVSDTLALLGAAKAVLTLHETMALKSVRAKANRLSNYDVSNINKSVESAKTQLEAVRTLKEKKLFDNLDEKLIEAAVAREAHPDASYGELAQILGISKSGVRHRLNKIMMI